MDIFLSHAVGNADLDYYYRLLSLANLHKISLWLPKRSGMELTVLPETQSAIVASDIVCVLGFNGAMTFNWVIEEVSFARKSGKPIVALLEEGIEDGIVSRFQVQNVEPIRFQRYQAKTLVDSLMNSFKEERDRRESNVTTMKILAAGALIGGLVGALFSSKD